jgi:hypothetical protein
MRLHCFLEDALLNVTEPRILKGYKLLNKEIDKGVLSYDIFIITHLNISKGYNMSV